MIARDWIAGWLAGDADPTAGRIGAGARPGRSLAAIVADSLGTATGRTPPTWTAEEVRLLKAAVRAAGRPVRLPWGRAPEAP